MDSHHKKHRCQENKCRDKNRRSCHENKTIRGNLKVKENLKVYGDARIKKDLDVCGDARIKKDLNVCGDATVKKDLEVCGNASVKKDLEVCGNAKVKKDLEVCGNAKVKKDLEVCGNAKVKKDLEVCGDEKVKGGLTVCGEIPPGKERIQEYQFVGTLFNPISNPARGIPPALPENTHIHEFDVDVIGTLEATLSWTPWDVVSRDPDLDMILYAPGEDPNADGVRSASIFIGGQGNNQAGGADNPETYIFPITEKGKWKAKVRYFSGSVDADYILDVKATEEVKGLKIKTFLDLSEASVIPDQHPCVGWWSQITKDNSNINFLIEIKRAPNGKLIGVQYYGSQAGQYRQQDLNDTGTNATTFQIVEVNQTELFLYNERQKPPYLFWDYNAQGSSFIIDENDSSKAHGYQETTSGESPGTGFVTYRQYVKLPERPDIEEFDSYNDFTDPRKIFEWFFGQIAFNTGTQMNTEVRATGMNPDWPGFAKVNAVKEQLLTESREYVSHVNGENGSTVWPTMKKTIPVADLPEDPFAVLKPYTITEPSLAVPGIIRTAFSDPTILVYDPFTSSDMLGMAVGISGATDFADDRISVERINSNFYVTSVIPGIGWFGLPIDRPVTWGQSVFGGGNNITITPLSAIVNIPSHGLSFFDLIEIEGAQSFNGISETELNGTFVVSDIIDSDNIIINFLPEIIITTDGTGGGDSVSTEEWTIPVSPDGTGGHTLIMFNRNTVLLVVTKYTTLITDKFNGFHNGGKLLVEGFEGDFSIINGEHIPPPRASVMPFNIRPLNEVYLDTFYNPETSKNYNYIPIALDTSALPVYNPEKHGTATITCIYGPVKADTGYYDLMGACSELFGQAVVGTHSSLAGWTDPFLNRQLLTWEDANDFAAFGTGFSGFPFQTRSINLQDSIGYNAYPHLPSLPNDLPLNAIIGEDSIDQAKRWDSSDGAKYDGYIISQSNYLDQTTVQGFFLRVNPNSTPDPDPLHVSNYLNLFGYNHNGINAPPGEAPLEFQISAYLTDAVLSVESPGIIAGNYIALKGLNAGSQVPFDLSGLDIVPTDPLNADTPLVNDLTGKIALIASDNFNTGSVNKCGNATNAGAIACIIFNSTGSGILLIFGSAIVPSIAVERDIGEAMLANLPVVGGMKSNPALDPSYNKRVGGNDFYFGLVKDKLTEGVKTGYVRVPDTLLVDFPGGLMAQTGWQEPDEIALYGNTRRMFALMMKYFTDNNVEKIIMDIRVNFGGFSTNTLALSSFFGGNRPGFENAFTPIGNGNGKMIKLTELLDSGAEPIQTNYKIITDTQTEIGTDDTASTLFSDFNGGTFLGSDVMFRGPDKKCVILNSTKSFSGGDIYPHFFRGTEAFPNDLGADNTDPNRCQSIFVGGADSRLGGGRSGQGSHNSLNLTSNLKATPSLVDNEPYPPMKAIGETFHAVIDVETGAYYANQLKKMAWVPGKDVGPLNCSFANAWYQDIGLADLGNYFDGTSRDVAPWTSLPNAGIPDNGTTSNNDTNNTWRDYALEEALRS